MCHRRKKKKKNRGGNENEDKETEWAKVGHEYLAENINFNIPKRRNCISGDYETKAIRKLGNPMRSFDAKPHSVWLLCRVHVFSVLFSSQFSQSKMSL